MSIFTNWIFWIILFSIIFILALIGYLTESKKKDSKKSIVKDNSMDIKQGDMPADNSNVPSAVPDGGTLNLDNGTWSNSSVNSEPAASQSLSSLDNWSVIPPVNQNDVTSEVVQAEASAQVEPVVTPADNSPLGQASTLKPTVQVEPVVTPADNSPLGQASTLEPTVQVEPVVTSLNQNESLHQANQTVLESANTTISNDMNANTSVTPSDSNVAQTSDDDIEIWK